ncbi:MAG: iron-sulfur cluster assembly protein, partial [Candidatus Limnocylindria bacterium]
MVNEQAILDALRGVKDPAGHADIVSQGLVKDLHIHDSE